MEVERLSQQLDRAWSGRFVQRIHPIRPEDIKYVKDPDWSNFKRLMTGSAIYGVYRLGKHLAVRRAGRTWLIHLRSTGWWLPGDPETKRATPPDPLVKHFIHAHAIGAKSLRVKLILRGPERDEIWEYHDPRTWGTWCLSDNIKLDQLTKMCEADWLVNPELATKKLVECTSARTAKDVLCDQHVTVGLGNYLSCEALHRAGVHPSRRWQNVALWTRLTLSWQIRVLLSECLPANDHSHWLVFKRKGQPCTTCSSSIAYIKDPGGARGSYYCPKCQPT